MLAQLDQNGSPLWYDVSGAGPRVVWVDPALGSSVMRPLAEAIDALRAAFEVVTYDRRGRGRSDVGHPTSAEQEIDDLAALVAHLGGADVVVGFSSGGALVVHAAPRLDAGVIVLLELAIDDRPDTSGLRERVAGHIHHGDPAAAVLDFYASTGTPEEIVDAITASDAWPDLVRSAPTLLADIDLCHVDDTTVAAVETPVHGIGSANSCGR